MSQASTYSGSCLCGAVKYQATGEPFRVLACHCRNCQKTTGSAFYASAFFRPSQVIMTCGEKTLKKFVDKATLRGVPLSRFFCPECGSNMFVSNDQDDFIGLAVGTLDEDSDSWNPTEEIFLKDKKRWVVELDVRSRTMSNL